MANYPSDESNFHRIEVGRTDDTVNANRYLPPLDTDRIRAQSHIDEEASEAAERVTVTRSAALRSREMGSRMYDMVQRAATADGADKSGLTALTWPVVANFAVDSAMAVALAGSSVCSSV